MVLSLFPSQRNCLKEGRCPFVSVIYVYGEHVKMNVAPKLLLDDLQFFISWKVN